MGARATVVVLALIAALASACELHRPWQPFGENVNPKPSTEDRFADKHDDAIGDYNTIPESLGDYEREFLTDLTIGMPRGVDVRAWPDAKDPSKIGRLAFRSLGLHSKTGAELALAVYSANQNRFIKKIEIYRSARYSPASWDYDILFHDAGFQGELMREVNRLHDLLAESALQGRVYLDATNVEAGRIVARLRDRRFLTGPSEEEALLKALKERYFGFEVGFTSRDVMDGEKLKQRIYDIELRGNFRGLTTFEGGKKLRWSPDGGPQHDPLPMDNDTNRRLIDRENAKRRPSR